MGHLDPIKLQLLSLFCFTAVLLGDVMPRAYDEYDVSDCLKQHGWVLPAYTMAPNAKHVKLLRAVIRCALRSKTPAVGPSSLVLVQI